MRRRRQAEARTAVDRDLHRHVGQAEAAVRRAIDVCGRAGRSFPREEQETYTSRARRLQAAERLLASVGYLSEAEDPVDMQQEARALLSWLEGRERQVVRRHGRRGAQYQDALRQVLAFLRPTTAPVVEPEVSAPTSEVVTHG